MNNLPKHHGAGPMQLHRLKASPDARHMINYWKSKLKRCESAKT